MFLKGSVCTFREWLKRKPAVHYAHAPVHALASPEWVIALQSSCACQQVAGCPGTTEVPCRHCSSIHFGHSLGKELWCSSREEGLAMEPQRSSAVRQADSSVSLSTTLCAHISLCAPVIILVSLHSPFCPSTSLFVPVHPFVSLHTTLCLCTALCPCTLFCVSTNHSVFLHTLWCPTDWVSHWHAEHSPLNKNQCEVQPCKYFTGVKIWHLDLSSIWQNLSKIEYLFF